MIAQNGHCKQGYFLENEPFGKFVEYNTDGSEFKKMGIYQDEENCVKELVFDDYNENITPNMLEQEEQGSEDDYVPEPHSFKRRDMNHVASAGSIQNTDGTNLTAKEEELENERLELLREKEMLLMSMN